MKTAPQKPPVAATEQEGSTDLRGEIRLDDSDETPDDPWCIDDDADDADPLS